jgi:hypothetical protein
VYEFLQNFTGALPIARALLDDIRKNPDEDTTNLSDAEELVAWLEEHKADNFHKEMCWEADCLRKRLNSIHTDIKEWGRMVIDSYPVSAKLSLGYRGIND